jgi:ribonucleoside-diphosphate reductase alpha chain
VITPEKTPELLSAIRVRHKTKFGHIHVTVVVDFKKDQELEIFAQLGRAGDQTYSDLEGMCRLASLFLRSGGSLNLVAKQLLGIGSNISLNGETVSVANSLGEALKKYLDFKAKHGLKSLILGEVEISQEEPEPE